MSTSEKFVGIIGFVIIGFLVVFTKPGSTLVQPSFGSVVRGSEYQATTTTAIPNGHRFVKTGDSILGSIIIASSSAGTLKVWNATSTTDTASTTAITFIASPTVGTYTYDMVMTRGIVLELGAGSNGSYNVTFR